MTQNAFPRLRQNKFLLTNQGCEDSSPADHKKLTMKRNSSGKGKQYQMESEPTQVIMKDETVKTVM